MKAPRSAAHPRPYNRPFYIDPNCPECGHPLVLEDLLEDPDTPEDEIWYDAWACPKCQDGMYLDWPQEHWRAVEEGSRRFEGMILSIPDEIAETVVTRVLPTAPKRAPNNLKSTRQAENLTITQLQGLSAISTIILKQLEKHRVNPSEELKHEVITGLNRNPGRSREWSLPEVFPAG